MKLLARDYKILLGHNCSILPILISPTTSIQPPRPRLSPFNVAVQDAKAGPKGAGAGGRYLGVSQKGFRV